MGSFVFRWPREANEVFVTGTFDDWGKTVQLEKKGNVFEKEVHLPAIEGKIQYKFVVDGAWVTDSDARQESDGHNNINNVLLHEDLKPAATKPTTEFESITGGNTAAAVMAGVVPEATTAQLAGEVPKENGSSVPGGFPETPATEVNELSVNPLPATNGAANPVKLAPGEAVPDPSTIHTNTVESTVRTDKAGYEADASDPSFLKKEEPTADALSVPPVPAGGLIPESSLPMNPPETSEPGVTIQSAHPTSTTAALAGQVPLESQKNVEVASDVPKVVKESLTKAHEAPEAAANATAVEEKAEVEKELQEKVGVVGGSAAVPASDVPEVVKESLEKAHQDPEAAASAVAVDEKKEVEQELQSKVAPTEQSGEPAPTTSAATAATAPTTTAVDSADVSPNTTSPPGTAVPATTSQTQPAVTTGVASGTTTTESKPVGSAAQDNAKEKKKKNRASGFFQKLKEKLK